MGWVCALAVELAAAQEMFGIEHTTCCRQVGEHNLVIACLSEGRWAPMFVGVFMFLTWPRPPTVRLACPVDARLSVTFQRWMRQTVIYEASTALMLFFSLSCKQSIVICLLINVFHQ